MSLIYSNKLISNYLLILIEVLLLYQTVPLVKENLIVILLYNNNLCRMLTISCVPGCTTFILVHFDIPIREIRHNVKN